MIRLFLIPLITLVVTEALAFQQVNCESLEDSDLIWDLNEVDGMGFSMFQSTSPGPSPNPICPDGGVPDNMSWFSFVAGIGNYQIILTPSNCVQSEGFEGIQAGMYTDCTFTESVECFSDCSTAPYNFLGGAVTIVPGEVYYFFLDGCAGSYCDITIDIVGDYTPYIIPEPTGLVCDFDCDAVLVDQVLNVAVEGIDVFTEFFWEVPNGAEVVNPLMPINFTDENNIDLRFTSEGVYNFCFDYATNGTNSTSTQVCQEINVIGEFAANGVVTNESSFMGNNGTASCMPNGSGSYTYNWNNGSVIQEITNLIPGEYIVTVSDQIFGLEDTDTVIVAAFVCDTMEYEIEYTDNSCFAICDASIGVVSIQNGVAPFTYVWSNNQTTNEIIGLCAGNYRVTITDSLNCQLISDDLTVQQPSLLLVNAEADNSAAIALPSGGTMPYRYLWSNGDSTQTITNLASGIYTVTVIDNNGCEAVESVITDIQFSVDSFTNINGTTLGSIYISTNTSNASYEWTGPNNFSSNTEDIVDLIDAGCYLVNTTDIDNGLSKDTTICISNLTSVADIELLTDVSLYPIPASDYLNVSFGSPVNIVKTIMLTTEGKVVYRSENESTIHETIQVDVSHLNVGVYFIKIYSEEGEYLSKLLVNR